LPAQEGVTIVWRGVKHHQASNLELGSAWARACGPSGYARHGSLSSSGKYYRKGGLLGVPAWAVGNIGIVDGNGCITDYDVR
jgi:hypothetical protein